MQYRRHTNGSIVRDDTIERWQAEMRAELAIKMERGPRKPKRDRSPRLNSRKRRRNRIRDEQAAQRFAHEAQNAAGFPVNA